MSEKTMEEQVFGQEHELDVVEPQKMGLEDALEFLKQSQTEA